MDIRPFKYCGHQGDVGMKRIYKKPDGKYYTRCYDYTKKTFFDKLYGTEDQMRNLLKSGKVVKPDKTGYTTLIEGESHDHHHGYKSNTAVTYELPSENNVQRRFMMDLKESTEFKHWHVKKDCYTKDHASFELPPGFYEVRSQMEMDTLNNRLKQVTD